MVVGFGISVALSGSGVWDPYGSRLWDPIWDSSGPLW